VDAWVISHPHHDPMPHTHPCRTITGLTVTLTPVIPITPMTHQLLQPPHGSMLPLTPFYQRNNTNTLPMPPKPTLALAKALYIVTSQSHKWLLERPLLVPRRDRCFAALQSYSLSGGRLGLLKKPWLPCSFTTGSERPLRQRCNVDSLRSLAMPSHPAEGSCAPYRCK